MGTVVIALCMLCVLAGVIVAGRIAQSLALSEIRDRGRSTLALDMALLVSELDRHRVTPVVLATDDTVKSSLLVASPDSLARISARLELLADQTGAAAIYVLNLEGVAVAANNYRTPLSFVGTDYAFRPYYQKALSAGETEYYALGTVSGRPGLYLSRRIDGVAGPLGVVVVKIDLDQVETAWGQQPGMALAADPNGVILLASQSADRFRTTGPLSNAQRQALTSSRQFGDAPLDAVGFVFNQEHPDIVKRGSDSFVVSRQTLTNGDWMLWRLTPTAAAMRSALPVKWIVGLSGLLLVVIGAWIWRARRHAVDRTRDQAEARRNLEDRVIERTGALTHANERLQAEIDDRERAEARLRTLQADLVQANRLAQLGQTVAGVAHEINQPVSAIRANADNALTLLSRGDMPEARANLGRIQGLTERIGTIVQDLRTLARKPRPSTTRVLVDEAIDGSMLLVASRIRRDGVTVQRHGDTVGIAVVAERIRLEQVLVNLLQNAFEAVDGMTEAQVLVSVRTLSDTVVIAVQDNGPGLTTNARDTLFTPFATEKPTGLGLGLVISRDIVESFDGTLSLDDGYDDGARFLVTLKRARP